MSAKPQAPRLFYQISRADRELLRFLARELEAAGIAVTPPQSMILFLLAGRDGLFMSQLARRLEMDNAALTRMADRLVKAGLVERRALAQDRRAQSLGLTPAGQDLAKRAAAIVRQANQHLLDQLTTTEQEVLLKALDKLRQAARQPSPGEEP